MKIIKEANEKEFKSYKLFLKYVKDHNLAWKDKGPFSVWENNGDHATIFKTVGDVLESFEEG